MASKATYREKNASLLSLFYPISSNLSIKPIQTCKLILELSIVSGSLRSENEIISELNAANR